MLSTQAFNIRKKMIKDRWQGSNTLAFQRKEWEEYAEILPVAEDTVFIEEEFEGSSYLRVKTETSNKKQAVFHIHGGGLCTGSAVTHREFASRFTQITGYEMILPNYPLAPENPYPKALHFLTKLYHQLLKEGYELIVGADSSGCSLALATLIHIKSLNIQKPKKVFFISGHFDLTLRGETMKSRENIDPFTSKEVLKECGRLYCGNMDMSSSLVSPLFADLSGLSPMFILAGNDEILLSDSLRLHDSVQEQGGESKLYIRESMWHVWPLYPDLPEANEAIEEIKEFLKG